MYSRAEFVNKVNKFNSNIFTESQDSQNGKEKKIVRTEEEVKKMGTKQYLDELVIPTLNKGLLAVNKEARISV